LNFEGPFTHISLFFGESRKFFFKLPGVGGSHSYSGGREQEDHSSKPTLANSSQDPISKTTTKKGWQCTSSGRAPA
jgi:hypothetical protein